MSLKSGKPYLVFSTGFRIILIAAWFLGSNTHRLHAGEDSLVQESVHYWHETAFEKIPKDDTTFFDTISPKKEFRRIVGHYDSKEFIYDDDQANRLSLLERISRRVGQFLNSLFPKWTFTSHNAVIYLITILGIFALIFIVRKVLFSGNKVIGKERREGHESEVQFIERNLNVVEIDEYIEKAVRDGELELAIRYLYLSVLQALSHKGIIEWDHRKTNDDFLSEIKDDGLKKEFREIRLIFDYVWFGEFKIDKLQFEKFKNEMINFKNQISS